MNFEELEKKLCYTFEDKDLLDQALTHPSKGYELKRKVPDNQRLEFLGDAVLQLALTVLLYQELPEKPEGELTQLRARLVNRDCLATVATGFDLGNHLQLGKGEELNKGRTKVSNLADALEAIIGAIYLDQGFDQASLWIYRHFNHLIRTQEDSESYFNPKGALQEHLQSQGKGTPVYETLEETGPDHSKSYKVAVKIGQVLLGIGEGSSKKNAEAEAAHHALLKFNSDTSTSQKKESDSIC
ncbi:MAG: ribonuclease III [Verrucomicrobiota bacterium]